MSSRKRPARTRVISYTKSSFVNKTKSVCLADNLYADEKYMQNFPKYIYTLCLLNLCNYIVVKDCKSNF